MKLVDVIEQSLICVTQARCQDNVTGGGGGGGLFHEIKCTDLFMQ